MLFFCRAKTARDEAGEILARFCFASEEDILAQERKKTSESRVLKRTYRFQPWAVFGP